MAEPTKDSPNKVSLEELLRFKRAERPDQDFWKEFDSELHHRMMQTLVKKDPWPVQVMRGLSGRIAQTTAIASAAAVLALMVIRPAFFVSEEQGHPAHPSAHAGAHASAHASVGVEESDIVVTAAEDLNSHLTAERDYKIEMVSASTVGNKDSVTPDYGMDPIDAANYDREAYSADMAFSGFTSTGVASLVY